MEKPFLHAWATERHVGERFTDGMEVLSFRGEHEAMIDSVQLVGAKGLRVVGVRLAGPERGIGSIQVMAWPPRDPELETSSIMPAIGVPLKPKKSGASYELLLGLEVTDEGSGYLVRKGVRVDYTVDGTHYSQYLPAALGVCTLETSVDPATGECPLPEGWTTFPGS